MTDLNRINSSNIDAYKADGTLVSANRDGAPSTYGVTLANATTYYFPVGAGRAPVPAESPLVSIHLRGPAALVAAITVEDTNFVPAMLPEGRGTVDVSDFDATAGNWIPENPSGATVSTVGAGWVATAATVNVAGGAAGGCIYHIGNLGSRRIRLKVVVTTGGLVRVAVHGKGAAA